MGTTTAYFAGGCFWCTEAVFQRLQGVREIVSGYMGGQIKNPAYREICTGRTGHAEAIRLSYDPEVISYEDLLHVFFATHDPTTLNRQGNDTGTQYRSAVFYVDETQKITVTLKMRDSRLDIARVLYIQFDMRNPIFRSKLSNFGIQTGISRNLEFRKLARTLWSWFWS